MDRRRVLELFEEQRDFVNAKVAQGIEENRKGDCHIVIVDKNGEPIKNAKVKAEQKEHEFRFGANIFMLDELETPEKNEAYKVYFRELFNMATLPFYWNDLEPERGKTRYEKSSPRVYRRPAPDLCLEFCEKYGIEPREHALEYEHMFPKWLANASVEEVKEELCRHFSEISERYADKIRTIEVTNESDWEKGCTSFYEEPDFILWCFKMAEKYFPNNQLAINDFTHLSWNDNGRATDNYYAYIEANLLKGARIDAIGMQYHLFNRREEEYAKTRKLLNPKKLYHQMDMYANFKKPLQITEVTVPSYSWESEDELIQAELIEKLYSIWFSHPATEQIIYWNLVDGYAYCEDSDPLKIRETQGNMTIGENYFHGGLLRFDLTPKPAYTRLKNLIKNVWHTSEALVTDDNGSIDFRGFYGKYELTITEGDKTAVKEIMLSSKEPGVIKIIL